MPEEKSKLPPRPPRPQNKVEQANVNVEEEVLEENVNVKEEVVNNNQPTFEELTSQIEDLRAQIKKEENELIRMQQDNQYLAEGYVRRKTKKYPSNREMASLGIKSKVVPVESKFFKYLDSTSKENLKCTTRPHVLKAIIKTLLFAGLLVAGILYLVSELKNSTAQEAAITNVALIFVVAIVCSFLGLKSSQLLDGYTSVNPGPDSVLDWIALITNIVGNILAIPARLVAPLFKGSKKMKYAGMSRLALPIGFGFEEIIEYGEEMESWNSLSATLDRVQNYDRNAETVKQIDEIIKTAEGMKMGATSDEIDEINDLIQTAEDKKAEFDE